MFRLAIVLVMVAAPRVSRADESFINFTAGPVFAVRISSGEGHRAIIGLEGGVGWGPERINIGFEHRSDHDAGYIEFDPWYIVGGTFGVAVDDEYEGHGVVGLWEGLPAIGFDRCQSDWTNIVTMSAGYRYTGVHELFLTIKGGRSDGIPCLGD